MLGTSHHTEDIPCRSSVPNLNSMRGVSSVEQQNYCNPKALVHPNLKMMELWTTDEITYVAF
jgi:hypothetical protein